MTSSKMHVASEYLVLWRVAMSAEVNETRRRGFSRGRVSVERSPGSRRKYRHLLPVPRVPDRLKPRDIAGLVGKRVDD